MSIPCRARGLLDGMLFPLSSMMGAMRAPFFGVFRAPAVLGDTTRAVIEIERARESPRNAPGPATGACTLAHRRFLLCRGVVRGALALTVLIWRFLSFLPPMSRAPLRCMKSERLGLLRRRSSDLMA